MTADEIRRLKVLVKKLRSSQEATDPGPELSAEERGEWRRLRTQYRRESLGPLFPWLSEVLYRHDPVHLRPCGVPPDEYECEAEQILPYVSRMVMENTATAENIRGVVYAVFHAMFKSERFSPVAGRSICGWITDEAYGHIAEEIAALIGAGEWVMGQERGTSD